MQFILDKRVEALIAFSFLVILCNASSLSAQNNKARSKKGNLANSISSNDAVQIDTSMKEAETCRARVLVRTSASLSEEEIKNIEGKGIAITLIFEPNIYLFESTNTKKTTERAIKDIDFLFSSGVSIASSFDFQPDYVIRSQASDADGKTKQSLAHVKRNEALVSDEPPVRGWGLGKIGARLENSPSEEEVTVAVLDYGVKLDHPSFKDSDKIINSGD